MTGKEIVERHDHPHPEGTWKKTLKQNMIPDRIESGMGAHANIRADYELRYIRRPFPNTSVCSNCLLIPVADAFSGTATEPTCGSCCNYAVLSSKSSPWRGFQTVYNDIACWGPSVEADVMKKSRR